jgi:uncharacterized protein (TIGR02118 family)
MIKTMGTAYRREDFTPEAFMQYWLDVHAPISAKAPGLQGYIVNEVVRRLQGDMESEAFIEQWYEDKEAFEASRQSEEVKAAWADVANYARTDGTFWQTREHVLIPPPERTPSTVKLLGTAYKRDDFTTEDFFRYWIDVHAPISARVPGVQGYVVTEVLKRLMGELVVEAFVEQWYESEEAFEASQGTPELAEAWEDVGKYARTDGTFWLVKEHVIIPPPVQPGILQRANG